jgi:hypothetical protein
MRHRRWLRVLVGMKQTPPFRFKRINGAGGLAHSLRPTLRLLQACSGSTRCSIRFGMIRASETRGCESAKTDSYGLTVSGYRIFHFRRIMFAAAALGDGII